jgi:hypothetical protein
VQRAARAGADCHANVTPSLGVARTVSLATVFASAVAASEALNP